MPCNKCGSTLSCDCLVSQFPVNCDPCTKNKYCAEKMDADCVFYNLGHPETASGLVCSGIPSNTSLSIILEKFDQMLCGFVSSFGINVQDTNSIDMSVSNSGGTYTISSNLKIDSSSTAPISITSDGLKVDCCSCKPGTTINPYGDISSLTKATNFYVTLQPNYFTASDILVSFTITDSTTTVGDTITKIKYYDSLSKTFQILNTSGGTVTMPTNICCASLKNTSAQVLIEVLTASGCDAYHECSLTTSNVPYSERYNFPYRANFQINDIPIRPTPNTPTLTDKGTIYFNDVKWYSPAVSNGGIIRKLNLNTNECISLAGNSTGGAVAVTLTDVWGDVVRYDYPSSVIIDRNEIINGEPVIYFACFNNVVVRLARERNTECDERANWRSYIIAGASNTTGNVSGNAASARFGNLYSLKRWYDYNGAPSFLVADSGNNVVKLLYYQAGGSATGGKNVAANWAVTNLNIPANNINVEDSPKYPGTKRLITLGLNYINFFDFNYTSPTLLQMQTSANYVGHSSTSNVTGYVDGNGSVAQVNGPVSFISKLVDYTSSTSFYLFHHDFFTTASQFQMLRKIVESGTMSSSSDYTYSTLIAPNTQPYGKIGSFSTANGLSTGFFTDLLGNQCDITYGGFRLWDFANSTITSIISGGASSSATTTEYNGDSMDTQYMIDMVC